MTKSLLFYKESSWIACDLQFNDYIYYSLNHFKLSSQPMVHSNEYFYLMKKITTYNSINSNE